MAPPSDAEFWAMTFWTIRASEKLNMLIPPPSRVVELRRMRLPMIVGVPAAKSEMPPPLEPVMLSAMRLSRMRALAAPPIMIPPPTVPPLQPLCRLFVISLPQVGPTSSTLT